MSTTAEIGLKPSAKILFFNHPGLSEFLIFLIIQLPKIEHACFIFFNLYLKLCFLFFFNFTFFFCFNFPKLEADKSLAIPRTPRQSGRLV